MDLDDIKKSLAKDKVTSIRLSDEHMKFLKSNNLNASAIMRESIEELKVQIKKGFRK